MRPATQEDINLFALMGQALLNIQVMEECLCVSTTLKVDVGYPRRISKVEADKLLKKRLSLPLGDAIKEALKEKVYPDSLQKALIAFRGERNWLVHKVVNDFYSSTGREALFQKVISIAQEAHRLHRAIEDDYILFAESIGLDMSHIRAAIKQFS